MSTQTPEELRAQIEATREELGETVEALAHKADVKARAKERVDEVRAEARQLPRRHSRELAIAGGAVAVIAVALLARRGRR